MKIIILSSSKNITGGVERFAVYLKDCLVAENCDTTIIGKEDLGKLEIFFIKISRFFKLNPIILGYFMGQKAKKIGFDICITNGFLGWNIKRGKIINVEHGTFARAAERIDLGRNFFRYFIRRYIWGYFEGLAARRATMCIAVSEETKESVEQYYHVNNVKVIRNAIDTDFFRPLNTQKKDQVIFVGRFEFGKGKEILEGIKKYLESKDWKLFVAEDFSQKELLQAYNESKIFILPSLHEGNSYALLDAMSCGLPFLASPVGLVSEFRSRYLFSNCIVTEQKLESYIKSFEILISKTEIEKKELENSIRNYVLKESNIKDFNKSYVDLIKN